MILEVGYVRPEKSGILVYRRKFTAELVPFIPGRSPTGKGRIELKRSLKARSLNEPGAKDRLRDAEAEFIAIEAKAQRLATRSFDALGEPLIRYLADTYLHDHLDADETVRWRGRHRPATYETRGNPEDVYHDCREMLDDYDSVGLVTYWKGWACQFADALGFLIDPADPEFPLLCRALGEAACSVWLSVDKRIDGDPAATPARPDAPDGGPKAPKAGKRRKSAELGLMSLYEKYSSQPGMHPKTVAQWRPYIAHLAEFTGKADALAITHDDLVAWRNHLRDEASYRGKRLSAKTVNGSYLGAASALFTWAKGDGLIPHNPMLEVAKVRLPATPKTRGKAFTATEAQMILQASLVPSASREGQHLRDAKRWCPWLMAYSGARVNEITQLRKEDIYLDVDVWVMRITPEAGTVKNKAFRIVPIHSHLQEQGFLDFVKGSPDGPLFYDPRKRRSDNAINRQSNRLGSKLAAWVHSLGIEGVKPNHAWRHLFSNLAVRHGLDPRVTKAITGHASSDIHDKVYLDDLPDFVDVLSRELEKMPRFLEAER